MVNGQILSGDFFMKKSTQRYIMVFSIILIFGMSSIAFVATGLFGNSGDQQQQQFKPLPNPVVEGELEPVYENTYVQNGFTWLKFYYKEPKQEFLLFVDSLPQAYTTNTGQTQLIVQKINSEYAGNENYIIISSQQGVENIEELNESKIINSLCRLLTVVPAECGFFTGQINVTAGTATNQSNDENSGNKTTP